MSAISDLDHLGIVVQNIEKAVELVLELCPLVHFCHL